MHEIHGHSLESTKWVIQSHIAAMFLPTFITPFLTKLFGFRKLINLGLMLFTLASLIGFYGELCIKLLVSACIIRGWLEFFYFFQQRLFFLKHTHQSINLRLKL